MQNVTNKWENDIKSTTIRGASEGSERGAGETTTTFPQTNHGGLWGNCNHPQHPHPPYVFSSAGQPVAGTGICGVRGAPSNYCRYQSRFIVAPSNPTLLPLEGNATFLLVLVLVLADLGVFRSVLMPKREQQTVDRTPTTGKGRRKRW